MSTIHTDTPSNRKKYNVVRYQATLLSSVPVKEYIYHFLGTRPHKREEPLASLGPRLFLG